MTNHVRISQKKFEKIEAQSGESRVYSLRDGAYGYVYVFDRNGLVVAGATYSNSEPDAFYETRQPELCVFGRWDAAEGDFIADEEEL